MGNFIHGRSTANGSDWIDVVEPYSAGIITRVIASGPEEVDRAVRSSRQALTGPWGKMSPLERQRLILALAQSLRRDAEFFAYLEAIDVGKPISEARSIDVPGSIDNLEYFAGWTSRLDGRTTTPVSLPGQPFSFTVKEPVGVVAAIVPWNFPLQTFVWKLAAALATGCTVVCKPSEVTPLSAMRLAELATEVGFPDGVINVVNGHGHVVGQELAAHPGVDKLSFTGSTRVGTLVGQTALNTMKRLTLELGGKSAVIVTDKADLDHAAEAILAGIFTNNGQMCDAGSRVYVDKRVHADLLERLKVGAEARPIGPGLDQESQITSLVSASHRSRVLEHIENAHSEGATLLTGEASGQPARSDKILAPTIFDGCSEEMRIFREEIFGPVLGVSSYDNLADAIERANSGPYGLAAALYSNDVAEIFRVSRDLKAGNVYVNAHGLLDPTLPFGGIKASGFGKDMGPEQLDSYLTTKSVVIQLPT